MVKQKLSCTLELYCEKSSFKRPLFFIHTTRQRERESAFDSRRIILTAFMTANISLCWSTLAPRQNYKLTHLFFWKSPHCLVLQNLFFALQSLISSFIQSPKNNKKKWVTELSWLPIRRAASLAPCRSLIAPFSPPEFNLEAVQDGFQVDSWVTPHHIHLVWARSFKWTKSRGEEFWMCLVDIGTPGSDMKWNIGRLLVWCCWWLGLVLRTLPPDGNVFFFFSRAPLLIGDVVSLRGSSVCCWAAGEQ